MKYLLDTHTWIWWNSAPEKLSARARTAIEDVRKYEELLLSSISPWEFSKLVELERLQVNCDGEQWIQTALNMAKLRLVELSPEIAWRSTTLPGEFQQDPADQIIVATARMENAIIITKDKLILDYPHVRSLW